MDWSTANHKPRPHTVPAAPRLIRTLCVMTRRPNKSVTAGIYEHPLGRELRVYYGQDENNIVSTEVSRTGDGPLEHHASELRIVLESTGWTAASKNLVLRRGCCTETHRTRRSVEKS